MISSQSTDPFIRKKLRQKERGLRGSIFFLLSVLVFCAILTLDWLLDFQFIRVSQVLLSRLELFFYSLFFPEKHEWIFVFLIPSLAFFAIKLWSKKYLLPRIFVISILLSLIVRYLVWRSLNSLNLTDPITGLFSISLFLMEVLVLSTYAIRLFLVLGEKTRHQEADGMSVAVLDGIFQPSVDILIPTYDEPALVLKRTIIGCQAIDYTNKKIYLLDDTKRPEIKALAKTLGCEYLTRPDNRHAKAGNLNHAIAHTKGDLIVVFDADFVPTTNFLTRTVGFFQKESVALVQTHQCFYNPDLIAKNLGLNKVLTHEFESFYRQYQLARDGSDSVLCSGSSFVVRRSAIEQIGGFVRESICEDYYTGVCLSARGYEVIYLDENLSAGLFAENMPAYISQRQRWARGTLQGLFLQVNPLTIPGLRLRQRISHLEGIVQWLANLCRVVFLVMPLAYYFLGFIPVQATVEEWFYFFGPYFLVYIATFSWLNDRSLSVFVADIYAVVQCFPISITLIQTLISPFSKGFKVTPKGLSSKKLKFNWMLALPLILVWIATWIGLGLNLFQASLFPGIETVPLDTAQSAIGVHLSWLWGGYNLAIVTLALFCFIDLPQKSSYIPFNLDLPIDLRVADRTLSGVTTKISEVGVRALINSEKFPIVDWENKIIKLEIIGKNLFLDGKIIQTKKNKKKIEVSIVFDSLKIHQERTLIKLIFCQGSPNKQKIVPGEIRSIFLLFNSIIKPVFLKANP